MPDGPGRSTPLTTAIATLARFTAIEALRSKLVVSAAIVIVAGSALGQFTTALAVTDSGAIHAVSLAWAFRVAAVFLLASFAVNSVVRDQSDKGLEVMLSLPLPRSGYLLGKFAGYAAIAVVLASMFAIPLAFAAPAAGAAAWCLSLALELVLIGSASLLCALTFAHVVGSMAAVAAFYTLSRVMGALLAIGSSPVAPIDSAAFKVADLVLHVIGAILPRLDLFTRSQWLIDGSVSPSDLLPIVVQSTIGVALLLAAALVDLTRKSV